MLTFEQIVERIVNTTGASSEEIMDRIRKVRERFELVTPEGAARIVAQEMGVQLETTEVVVRPLKIEDLAPGMSRVDLVARVVRVYPLREFQHWSGRMGRLGGVLLQDRTGAIRLALWDNQTNVLEEGLLKKGDVIRVRNAYVTKGLNGGPELRLGSRGGIEPNPQDPRVGELPELSFEPVKLADLRPELREVDVMGRVIGLSQIRTFERPGGGAGKVASLILDDGTKPVRVSLWDHQAELVNQLQVGEALLIENATVKIGLGGALELSVGARGRVVRSPPGGETLPPVKEKRFQVKDIEAGMPSVSLAARVIRLFPPVEFQRSDGTPARVVSAILGDETGTIRVSFWNDFAKTAEELKSGDVVVVKNAYSKLGLREKPELHTGRNSTLEVNPPGVEVGEFRAVRAKLEEVEVGDECLEVVGRVLEVQPVREFTRPDGTSGKVASFSLIDETAVLRVNLWYENADLVAQLKPGDLVRLSDAYSSAGLYGLPELHLGRTGGLELNPEGVELPPLEELKQKSATLKRTKITEISREGERVEIRGTVVHVFQRRPFFFTCPECGRGLEGDGETVCGNCGKSVVPEARTVMSFLCDDGTGNIRVTVFGNLAEQLLGAGAQELARRLKEGGSVEELFSQLDLMGKELIVRGTVKYDKFTDLLELRGFGIEAPEAKREAERLLEEIKAMEGQDEGGEE